MHEFLRDRLRDATGRTGNQRTLSFKSAAPAISFSDSRHLQILFAHLYSILQIKIRF